MLASIGIPFQTLPDYQEGAEKVLATAKQYLDNAKGPYCIILLEIFFSNSYLN